MNYCGWIVRDDPAGFVIALDEAVA